MAWNTYRQFFSGVSDIDANSLLGEKENKG